MKKIIYIYIISNKTEDTQIEEEKKKLITDPKKIIKKERKRKS